MGIFLAAPLANTNDWATSVPSSYTLVTADIFARQARLRRPETPAYFLAGTDEHGFKLQKAALARDLDPAAFCDELSAHFRVCLTPRHASDIH